MSNLAHPVSYRRSGGHEPADDERLEVAPDGSFELWRSVSVGRVGAFAGTLDGAALDELGRHVDAADAAGRAAAGAGDERVRGRALEELFVGDTGVVLGGAGTPSEEWAGLLRAVRHLVLDLVDGPVAALEARLAPDASALTLEVIGSEALGVDLASGQVSLHALQDGVSAATWHTSLSAATGATPASPAPPEAPDAPDELPASLDDAIAASMPRREPGWSLVVPLTHDLSAPAEGRGPAWQADVTGRLEWQDRTTTFSVRTTAPNQE